MSSKLVTKDTFVLMFGWVSSAIKNTRVYTTTKGVTYTGKDRRR